jgi:hypothetical protein
MSITIKNDLTGAWIEQALVTLEMMGFSIGFPDLENISTWDIDQAVAKETICESCGSENLSLIPFVSSTGDYRAVGLCRCCRVTEI